MGREGFGDVFSVLEDDSCDMVLHVVGLCFPMKPFPGAGNPEKGVRKCVEISDCQRQLWLTEKGRLERIRRGQVLHFFSNWFYNYNYN